MARRKKRVHHHRRRRRVGAISGDAASTLQGLAGAVAGAVINKFVDNIIAKQTTVKIDDKTLQFIKMLAGGYAAWKLKQPFLRAAGLGFAAQSAVAELTDMGVLKGIGRVDPRSLSFPNRLNGPAGGSQSNFPAIGEAVRPNAVGGISGGMYAGIYE